MKKLLFTALLGLSLPGVASAHAFGQQYVLPLPAWLYIYGGGAVVIVSFLLIAYFVTETRSGAVGASVDLARFTFFRATKRPLSTILKYLSLFLFLLVIATGIFGSQQPTHNFAPNFFWIVFLLGFTYLVALFGNLWEVANPWKLLAQKIGEYKVLTYPTALGYTPALLFYFFLIWLELISGGLGTEPETLALYVLLYSAITLAGAGVFGIKEWFTYADMFSVFFTLVSKLSPVIFQDGKVLLRWPFAGLLEGRAEHVSLLLFIIFMLSSTAYDGFRETVKAFEILAHLSFINSPQLKDSLLLFSTFALFIVIYSAATCAMKFLVKSELSIKKLALAFAYSLIPIALAYNLAHYYTLLLIEGQRIISIISDPFNLGWNLFGTSYYVVNVGIVGAQSVWLSQVAFILIGHVAAIYIAHLVALKLCPTGRQAFISQLPMLLAMVVFTMAGLWILSQPLTIG